MTLDHLMKPLAVGPTELGCRIVSTAHQTTLVHNHLPTADFVAYQEARAQGGVGLIIMEAVAVAPSGLLTSHTLGGYLPEMVDGYRRIAAATQRHGTRLFVQLFHGGREVMISAPRPVVVSSSALPSHRYHTEPRALRTDEVREIVAGYGRCAALAAEAGLDGIEITAAHGYLGEQFFTPSWNERDDRYADGSQFIREVLEAVRGSAPDLALGVRVSADSQPAQDAIGAFVDLVDYVHVAIGNSATFDGCVNIVPPPPTPEDVIAGLTEPFQLGKPLIATSRVIDPVHADRLIAEGRADAFGMNRALITDPEMPVKARNGRFDEILRCIGCNACIAHYHAETPIRCAQNPRTGRELTLPHPAAGGARGRFVVVGAGPAGLAAAIEAASQRYDVTLFEASDHLGGQVWLAGQSPAHRELYRSLHDNYDRLLDRLRVSVELNTEADVDDVIALDPAVVVVATGARPYRPRHFLEGVKVVQVWDVLAGARFEGRTLIADWGGDPSALDCAEMLAAEGREVALAVGAVSPGETLHQYQRNAYIGRLLRAGVEIHHYLGLHSASGGHVNFRNIFAPELESSIPADVLAVAMGRVPHDGLAVRFRAAEIEVEEAGDCRSPRTIEEAILEGTLAARRATERVATPAMSETTA